MTSGACRPLAPCTVMTRTAPSGPLGLALHLGAGVPQPVDETLQRRRVRPHVGQRGAQQFVDRLGRFRPEPGQQPGAAAERAERLHQQRVRRNVVHAGQQASKEGPGPRPVRALAARGRAARATASRAGPMRQAPSGRHRSGRRAGWSARRRGRGRRPAAAGRRRRPAGPAPRPARSDTSRSSPATGTPWPSARRTRARAKSARRRTRTRKSPAVHRPAAARQLGPCPICAGDPVRPARPPAVAAPATGP